MTFCTECAGKNQIVCKVFLFSTIILYYQPWTDNLPSFFIISHGLLIIVYRWYNSQCPWLIIIIVYRWYNSQCPWLIIKKDDGIIVNG